MIKKPDNKIMNVPQQIFDQFLQELEKQKVAEEVLVRLRKTLIDNKQISVEALKTALFFDDVMDI